MKLGEKYKLFTIAVTYNERTSVYEASTRHYTVSLLYELIATFISYK